MKSDTKSKLNKIFNYYGFKKQYHKLMGGLICIKTNTYDALEIQDNQPIFLDLDNEVKVLDAEIIINN